MATEETSAIERSPSTIVVAEHYPSARASLADLLSYDGYRVFQAANVEAALSCIDSVENLSVLLTDLDMRGWRSLVRYAGTRTDALVIAMEGNHPISAMYDLKEHGIRLCLRKPIIYNDLRAAISGNLGYTARQS